METTLKQVLCTFFLSLGSAAAFAGTPATLIQSSFEGDGIIVYVAGDRQATESDFSFTVDRSGPIPKISLIDEREDRGDLNDFKAIHLRFADLGLPANTHKYELVNPVHPSMRFFSHFQVHGELRPESQIEFLFEMDVSSGLEVVKEELKTWKEQEHAEADIYTRRGIGGARCSVKALLRLASNPKLVRIEMARKLTLID